MDPEYEREMRMEGVSLEEAYERMRSTYDRLAAENAELRKERDAETVYLDLSNKQLVIDYEQALKDLTAANATLDEERAAYAVLLESHEIILDALTESDATLDALREVVPEDSLDFDEMYPDRDFDDLELVLRSILYPQPAVKEKT